MKTPLTLAEHRALEGEMYATLQMLQDALNRASTFRPTTDALAPLLWRFDAMMQRDTAETPYDPRRI
jgi:hypothetical protein